MQVWKSLSLIGLITACSLQAAEAGTTLYERLGGKPAIQAVASGLVDSILADSRVNKWFTHAAASPANAAVYKAKLSQFLCQSTQGPCKYTGMDMSTAHKGRKITTAAFDAVVEDLVKVLDDLKVPAKEKAEVLAMLGPLKTVIVQK